MKQKTLTIQDVYREGQQCLSKAGIAEYALDAWYLLEYVTGITKASYYGNPDKEISGEEMERYDVLIRQRSMRIPLQHLTGEQEFMGLPFFVNEHVLIPRQDTETLVEEGLKAVTELKSGGEVLDMCTGSGCILLSIMKLCKRQDISGTGVDISREALQVAKENAKRLETDVVFLESDLFAEISEDKKYDLILSNPPYIRTSVIEQLEEEVRLHDPYIALNGLEDGLFFYRRIIAESVRYIKPGGSLMFEIGCDQAEAVKVLMKEAGYKDIRVKKDLAGLDRMVSGRYNEE